MHTCKHEEKIDIMYNKLLQIDNKLDTVLSFKYKIIGALIVIGFFAPIMTSIVLAYVTK